MEKELFRGIIWRVLVIGQVLKTKILSINKVTSFLESNHFMEAVNSLDMFGKLLSLHKFSFNVHLEIFRQAVNAVQLNIGI